MAAEVGPASAVADADEEEGLSRLRLLVDSGPDGPAAPGAIRSVLSSDVYAFIPTADPAAGAAGSRSQLEEEEDFDPSFPALADGQSRSAAAASRGSSGGSGQEPVGAEEVARAVSDLIRRLGVMPYLKQHTPSCSATLPCPPHPIPTLPPESSTLCFPLPPSSSYTW